MQTMDTEVDGCTLTGLNDFIIQLLLHLGYHLLDTGWVDTAIGYQLMESQTANLTAHRVEG